MRGPEYGCVRSTSGDPLQHLSPLPSPSTPCTEIRLAHCAGLDTWISPTFARSRSAAAIRSAVVLTRSHRKNFGPSRVSSKRWQTIGRRITPTACSRPLRRCGGGNQAEIVHRRGPLLLWARTGEHRNASEPPPELRKRPSGPRPNARRRIRSAQDRRDLERAPGPRGEPCGSIRRSAAAISAGFPWLTFFCPACRVVGSVDLRTLDRPPGRIDLKPDPNPCSVAAVREAGNAQRGAAVGDFRFRRIVPATSGQFRRRPAFGAALYRRECERL